MTMHSTLARRMTTEREVSPEKTFVPAFLPWLVAGGALAIYLVTLNRWVSLSSLQQVARVSGWTWQPELYGPLFWLVTYPFRWLPAQVIPLALNLFAAVCAALSLALLARSVALLPHDRTARATPAGNQQIRLSLDSRSLAAAGSGRAGLRSATDFLGARHGRCLRPAALGLRL